MSIVNSQLSIPVYAHQDELGYSRLHPASPFYFLKTIRENLELKFAVTPRIKNLRQLEFATRRLREARTLISVNENLIPPTLERYAYHLKSLDDKHEQNDEFVENLNNSLSIHLNVLREMYTETSNLRAKMFIRSAMNRIIQRADVSMSAKIPVCDLFVKESSSSALNETEKWVLLQRSQQCKVIKM